MESLSHPEVEEFWTDMDPKELMESSGAGPSQKIHFYYILAAQNLNLGDF